MPTHSLSPFERLSQWLAAGDLEAAEAYWQKREKGEKVPARLVELGAKVAEKAGRWDDALQRWQRCAAADPERRSATMGQARALLQLKRWGEARDMLRLVLRDEPDRLPAHEMAARVAMQLGLHDEALTHWQRAAEDPRFSRAAGLALMELHEQAGDLEQAAVHAMALRELPRLPAPVLKTLLRLCRATDRWAGAVHVLKRLLELEPTSQRHRLALAQCQIELRAFEAARVALEPVDHVPALLPTWRAASRVVRGQADQAFLTAHACRLLQADASGTTGQTGLQAVHQMTVLLDLAADARVSSLQQVLSQGRAAGASPALQRMVELALTAAQGQVLSAPATEDLAPPAQALLGLLLAHLQALAGQFAAALTTLDGVSIPALTLAIGEEACQRQGIMLRHTCLLRLGRLDAARQVLDRGLQAGLDRDWLAGRAADLFLHGLADADAACRWLGDVPVQVWQQPFARQDHALALARCGQASRAVDQLDARLAVRADDDDARVALAGVLQAAGDPAGALATLNPLWQRAGLRPLAYRDATQRLLPEGVMASGAAAGVPAQPNDPLVSIVLTLQGPHPHLLASVRSVMAQSWQRLELLLVDVGLPAGWSDALLQALGADPRVRLVRLTPGMGVAAARNAAWLQARGDYLWFSDADAWWHPEALATQVAALQVQPQWLACRHLTLRVDGSGQLLFRPERPLQPGGVSCLLMRRSVVERLGGFDDVAQGFNAEFLQRLVRTWGVAQLGDVPLPLRLTTRHEGSAAAGADLPQHWYGHDVAVDQYLHAARRWLNEAALRTPVLVSDTDERPFLIPPGL